MKDEHCPHCGQRMGYRSSVSRGTADVLKMIFKKVTEKDTNAVHIEKELVQTGRLTGNQGRNCTHMVRLGLIAHIKGEPGNYCLTNKGIDFLNGLPIPKYVTVEKRTAGHGSRTVTHSEETCTIKDFNRKGEYWEVPGFEIKEGRVIPPNAIEI